MPQDFGVESPAFVAIRVAQSIALVVLLGILSLQIVVLPRYLRKVPTDEDTLALAERAARPWVAAALLAFGLATIARLGAQHAAVFGATEDWSLDTMRALILQSRWGLTWCLAALGAAAGWWAQRRMVRGRAHSWILLAVSVMVMVVAISMSGHAAAADSPIAAITVHALHLIGAGGWMGSLTAMMVIAIPLALATRGDRGHEVIAGLLNAFSPTALAFASLAVITGAIAAWRNLVTFEALWQSQYGQIILAKLAVLSVAALTGGYNWKRVLPTLGAPTGTARLRISAGVEIVAALVILVITAVLVATPMPTEMMISAARASAQREGTAAGETGVGFPLMQLGIYTFAEATPDATSGYLISPEQRLANLMEEVALSDEVGLDVFGIGEHHRADYVVSTPAVVLAAAAMRSKRIRLTSAVTVLSSDDPVRVFQEYATVDLLSHGRAEIMAGRGSFIESFPLFGYDLHDYDTLFSEKLELLLKLRTDERVTWQGQHRAPLKDQPVFPRPAQHPIPLWVAVGGTPQSVVRAATLGLPMALAIIGGSPERFKPFVDLYRESWARAGHDAAKLQVSINSHGFIADTDAAAADAAFPPYLSQMGKIGRERGWPPPTRRQFDAEISTQGALFVGGPQRVIDKILWEHELFGHTRALIQFSVGSMPHDQMLRAIELYGTVVAPAVRKALGR